MEAFKVTAKTSIPYEMTVIVQFAKAIRPQLTTFQEKEIMEAAKVDFLTKLGLVEYWKEHTEIRYGKYKTVYSKTNAVTKTIYGVFINEEATDEMLIFKALHSNNYEVLAKDVKGNASNEEVSAHIAKYKSEKAV